MTIDRKTKEQTNKDSKYCIKFIDRFIFMSTYFSNFTDSLSGKLHQKMVINVNVFLNMKKINYSIYNCVKCEKHYEFKLNEKF